ncbi:MAG: hypothetical protein JXB35_15110 [Anaerolineae bacterium]|nr:hypothetical protein [Anaerolineae bacterium]
MRTTSRWFLIIILFGICFAAPAAFAQAPSPAIGVYYVGPGGIVIDAIEQSEPYLVLVDRPELAQVLVLDNAPLSQATLQEIGRQILRDEVGLVVILGDAFPQNVNDLRALLGVGIFGLASGVATPRALINGREVDSLQSAITWNSAPEIEARTVISNPNLLLPVVQTVTGEPLVQRVRGREERQVFVVGAWLNDESNQDWASWPYFDYLVYRMIAEAAGAPRLLSFAEYPLSPVPKGNVRWVILALGLGAASISFIALYIGRRRLFLHPEQASTQIEQRIANRPTTGWESVGFHRILAGFLTLSGGGLLMLLPWAVFRLQLLPDVLLPWPQALGSWEIAGQWLGVAWLCFDMGTGLAATRFFAASQSRLSQGDLSYFQFYVWWQLLSGAVQLAVVAWLATLVFPSTAIAYLSFYLVAHAIIQFPGFSRSLQLLFRANQRFDYEQTLNSAYILAAVVFQVASILVFRAWGATHPEIGTILGGIFGLGIGLFCAEWFTFLSGLLLFRRLGYTLRRLLVPAFDVQLAGRVLAFGARLALGSLAIPLGFVVQVTLLSGLLPDYGAFANAWSGLAVLLLAYEVLNLGLATSLMPALTEALLHEYQTLARYYLTQGLHYGMWFSLFLLSMLAAAGERFVAGTASGIETYFATLFTPVIIWGSLQWPAWITEQALVAGGQPALRSSQILGEQIVRLALIALLTPELGVDGVWIAFLGAGLLRGLTGLWLVEKLLVAPHPNFWQMVVAPGSGALVTYNLLRWLLQLFPDLQFRGTLLLVVATIPLLLSIYGFVTAVLGGWDDGGIAELRSAAQLSGLGLPLAWLLYLGVSLGKRVSPLHGRFALRWRDFADHEAEALTMRRWTS